MSLAGCKKILILGGSFDPPHVAHLIQPRLVAEKIGADRILYIPAGWQPQKSAMEQTEAHHRLAMLRLMVAGQPDVTISTMEIDRLATGKPSYTVDTLLQLRESLSSVTPLPELRLLIGSDQALNFTTWHRYQDILSLAQPVVMTRPPLSTALLLERIAQSQSPAAAQAWRDRIVELPLIDVSSTAIRQRVNQGLSIAGMVTPAVADYLQQHGLYR